MNKPATQQQLKALTPKELWLECRKRIIGGSDIWGLVCHYDMDLLLKLWDKKQIDKPFKDAYEIWQDKKGFPTRELDKSLVDIGNYVENIVAPPYIETQFGINFQMNPGNNIDYRKELNPWLGATLDGRFTEPVEYHESFDHESIYPADGCGIIECKAMNHNAFYKKDTNYTENGLPLKYIFQLNHQMLVTNRQWGVIIVGVYRVPRKDEKLDVEKPDYFYGEYGGKLCEIHCEHFVYKRSKNICDIILSTSNKFNSDWEADKAPIPHNFDAVKKLDNLAIANGDIIVKEEADFSDDAELSEKLLQLETTKQTIATLKSNVLLEQIKEQEEIEKELKESILHTVCACKVATCGDYVININRLWVEQKPYSKVVVKINKKEE